MISLKFFSRAIRSNNAYNKMLMSTKAVQYSASGNPLEVLK